MIPQVMADFPVKHVDVPTITIQNNNTAAADVIFDSQYAGTVWVSEVS